MGDAISRQQAIRWVKTECNPYGKPTLDFESGKKVIEHLEQMSPAQPDIVRCKDCKHHWTHKCMDSMPIERCDLEQTFYDAEIDFCSLAERREVTE